MRNSYIELENHIEVIINSYKYGEVRMLVNHKSLDVLDTINGSIYLHWSEKTKSFYARAKVNGKHKYIHRLLMDAEKGKFVDHKNHNTLDNRFSNLKIVNNSQNMLNRKGAQKNNKSSGVRGVSWDKSKGKWKVALQDKFIGRYTTIEEAKEAFDGALGGVLNG